MSSEILNIEGKDVILELEAEEDEQNKAREIYGHLDMERDSYIRQLPYNQINYT